MGGGKLLTVYNTFAGTNGQPTYYIDALRSILNQKFDGEHKIVVSGCVMHEGAQAALCGAFGFQLSYNWIEDRYPLSITFNHTVDKMIERFGAFDGYLYIDSGINMWDPCNRYDAVQRLWEKHNSGPYAITAAMPSNDDGSSWWGIQYKRGYDYIFPVSKTTNMHAQIFSEDWRKAFGKILPDIFGSNSMESIFTFMSGSIKKRFIITQDVQFLHLHSLDGASQVARIPSDDFKPMSKMFQCSGKLYKAHRDMDDKYRDGQPFGFGFESISPYWPFDPSKYDNDGYALDERLAPFIAKEMYLSPEEFDYKTIRSNFMAGS